MPGDLHPGVTQRSCNLSFDHGATYDYCRVTLAFNIKEGDVEGVDIGGAAGGWSAATKARQQFEP
jgi:hypothetical protein